MTPEDNEQLLIDWALMREALSMIAAESEEAPILSALAKAALNGCLFHKQVNSPVEGEQNAPKATRTTGGEGQPSQSGGDVPE